MNDPRLSKEQRRERVRQRVKLQFDEDKYEYYPGVEPPDYYNNDVRQLVAIYVRVSTDDPRQTTSFEIQRQYYEEFGTRHPNWVLVDIYADEGISGTSLKHRDQFNRMIDDCRAGKITLIICKSVSRFARNVVDFLGMVRMLSEHNPPICVFFEAENIFSLNETAQMALSFQATMAEEESRNKSRSMETSLRMRLDHGLLLTPKLLGFMHDDEGHLIPDPRTRHLPKLIFYMYLYGYTTAQIAEALTFVGQRTYRGNIRWQPAVISYVLHNERYCGDVFTRKTYTQDVLTHRKLKNRGQRPRSRYLDTHEAIISRDDFIAVQHRLNNARFGSKSILPELMVIPQGLLRGFVIINPRWGAFQAQDYRDASMSAYMNGEDNIGSSSTLPRTICAVSALTSIYDKHGYHVLDRTLRLCVGTWEGERNSYSANILNGIARCIVAYGNTLQDDIFKDKVGKESVKTLVRTAKERMHGSLGYAEAMVIFYNKRSKAKLPIRRLYGNVTDEELEADEESIEDYE